MLCRFRSCYSNYNLLFTYNKSVYKVSLSLCMHRGVRVCECVCVYTHRNTLDTLFSLTVLPTLEAPYGSSHGPPHTPPGRKVWNRVGREGTQVGGEGMEGALCDKHYLGGTVQSVIVFYPDSITSCAHFGPLLTLFQFPQ